MDDERFITGLTDSLLYRNDPLASEDEDEELVDGLTNSLLGRGTQSATEQRQLNPLARTGLGAARGVASLLEPLALPQDVAFAIAAGALDDNSTITERLKRVEWAAYAPTGAAPARPADGREILSLMGVEDERALRWGGAVFDLTVDPLIAGSVIRAGGKLSKIEDLVKLGDKVDEIASYSVPLVGQARAAYRYNPTVKAWADKRSEELLRTMRNPDNKLFGYSAGEWSKGFVTGRVTRNLRYGSYVDPVTGERAGEAISDARALTTQRAEDVRTRGYDLLAEMEAGILGKDARPFFKRGLDILSGAAKAEREVSTMPQLLRDSILKEGYDLAQKRGVLTTEIGESVIPEVRALSSYTPLIGRERRAAALADTDAAVARVRDLAERNKFSPDLAEKRFRDFGQRVTEIDAMFGYHVSGFDFIKKRVMEKVMTAGGSSDDAANLWNDAVSAGVRGEWNTFKNRPMVFDQARRATPAPSAAVDESIPEWERRWQGINMKEAYNYAPDEEVQYYLKGGYMPAHYQGRLGNSYNPADYWRAARTAQRMRLPPQTAIGQARYGLEEATRRGDTQAQDAFRELLSDLKADTFNPAPTGSTDSAVPTFGSLVADDEAFNALDLGAYFKGLQDGHMRRTYAMFQDNKSADKWVESLRTGKVVMSNLLGDDMVDTALRDMPVRGVAGDTAVGRNVADLIKGYRGALETEGRGTILTQRGIVNHLLENGVAKRDAEDAYGRLITQMNPELEPVIKQLREYADKYENKAAAGRSGGFGPSFYGERNDELDVPFLEMLGEYANPILSLAESADAAKTRIGRQDFMREVYELGVKNGLVKEGDYTDPNGAVFKLVEGAGGWGAFDGKKIHPYLKMELERSMKPPAIREIPLARAYDRVRSLITGGYLASPSVITANIAGGIYTSAMAGIGPGRMMKAMAQTFTPLLKGESEELKRLKDFTAVEDASMAANNMVRDTGRLKLVESGVRGGSLNEAFDNITGFIGEQLQAPLGQRWAGLDGFQFVEKWMRTAAFKAEKDYWIANQGRLAQYGVDMSGDAAQRTAAVEKFAAQKARISVMDYSELPDLVTGLRDTGLLMFPGFSYLITARNLNAAINRPGKIAMADRLSDAIWSATMDEEEKLAVYAGMPDWLKEDQGVPVRLMVDKAGDRRYSVIPFSGLLPVNTTFGKPFAESMTALGIYGPLFEMASALVTGEGEAVLTGRFGREVFQPQARGAEKYAQAGAFLANSLFPAFVRKGIDMGQAIQRQAVPMDPEFADTLYSFQERDRGKAQKRIADEVLSSLLRSPQVVTTSGPLSNWVKQANSLRIRRDAEVRGLTKELQKALSNGNGIKAAKIREEIAKRTKEYAELTQTLAAMAEGGRR